MIRMVEWLAEEYKGVKKKGALFRVSRSVAVLLYMIHIAVYWGREGRSAFIGIWTLIQNLIVR